MSRLANHSFAKMNGLGNEILISNLTVEDMAHWALTVRLLLNDGISFCS